jgi:hypothetical protein
MKRGAEQRMRMDTFDKAVVTILASGCIGSTLFGLTHLQEVRVGGLSATGCEKSFAPEFNDPMRKIEIGAGTLATAHCTRVTVSAEQPPSIR